MRKRTAARAVHSKRGNTHFVMIENLRVLITAHHDCWFAQGVEIDFGVEGNTRDQVMRAFEYGLAATIAAHLKKFHHIENLLRPAPPHVQRQAEQSALRRVRSEAPVYPLPFEIEFLEAAA